MRHIEKVGYVSLLVLIFLLPLFFLPAAFLPMGVAKSLLLTLGAVVTFVTLMINAVRHKSFTPPAHSVLWLVLALPLVYLTSAIVSGSFDSSFFGYTLESGTAASIIVLAILFLGSAMMFRDRARLIRALSVFLLSLTLLGLFVAIKIVSHGAWLNFGNFSGAVANPLGVWTDLAVIFGLVALLVSLAFEMLPVSGALSIFLWVVYVLSVLILGVVNFSIAWVLVLGASVILLIYFITVEKADGGEAHRTGLWMTGLLIGFSLLFLWNPNVGSKNLSMRLSDMTQVVNTDIRPSLGTTLDVAKGIFNKSPLLGSGPNTFSLGWLLYRPAETNATAFWNTAFPFGFGFLPTTMASTGLLGILVWAIFFILLATLGVRVLAKDESSRPDRFILLSTLTTTVFLWVAVFLYIPSSVVLALTFIFTGLFVGAAQATGVIHEKAIVFNRSKLTYFVSILAILIMALGTIAFSLTAVSKLIGAYHFNRAVVYSNLSPQSLDDIEMTLGKAINASPADQYWRAVSQVELSRANNALVDALAKAEDRQKVFQESLSRSIAALQNAVTLNPNYSNWIALSNVYGSLVPAPFAVEGAYESTLETLNSALAVNPESPEVPLLLARLEIDHKNIEQARAHIAEALNKKQDYADAYFLLAQLEVNQNNLSQAIRSAETGVLLSPGNAGVLFQLGLLKYSNKDYLGAVDALSKALNLLPNYANAKYYLGLSFDRLGQQEEALKEFEDLAKTNPDNELVKKALENLRAGKSALVETPTTPTKAPPITGQ